MRRDRCSDTVRVPVKRNWPDPFGYRIRETLLRGNITRGAVETSYLYIRMGHTTYTHLNDTYLVVGWIGAIGLHRHLSTCT